MAGQIIESAPTTKTNVITAHVSWKNWLLTVLIRPPLVLSHLDSLSETPKSTPMDRISRFATTSMPCSYSKEQAMVNLLIKP